MAVGVVCVTLALALGVGPAGAAGMLPLVIFQSLGLCSTGIVLIRSGRPRAGAWLGGGALVAQGLHLLDAPLLSTQPELFLWGFALALALQVLAALGMLMLYYEHARAELLAAQQILERTRRMEALGRIAGGVAHDFNNMLTVTQGHLDMLRARGELGPAAVKSVAAIAEATQRAARLTQQLLAFGRRAVIRPVAIDVGRVVADTLELLRKVIPPRIQLDFRRETGPVALIDQTLVEQIVLNLVTNARDAIRGDGTIRLELTQERSPRPLLRLRVSDDGDGMDADTVQRVFEPFFTSKPTGQGTGLGLASVQGAVQQLGGSIRVESVPGRGSTFEVELPWEQATRLPAPSRAPRQQLPLTILVVDDDDAVRGTTAEILIDGGHEVDQAADGIAALELLRARDCALVISDVVMPRMGGLALCEEIAELRPATAVILTSGHPADAGIERLRAHYLAKPFGHDELLDVVARVAATRSSPEARDAG